MRGTPLTFSPLSRGLNAAAAPFLLETGEASDLLNVVGTKRGGVRKRPGCELFTPYGRLGTNNTAMVYASSLNRIVVWGTYARVVDSGGNVTDVGSTTGGTFCAAEFRTSASQGAVFASNGANTYYWAGSGTITAWSASNGTVPPGRAMAVANNRLWVANTPADPDAVFWSDIGNPFSWPPENVVRLDPGFGGPVVGMAPVGPYLVAFKRSKAFVIYDLDTGANRPISANVGLISPNGFVSTPYGLFFVGFDGIYQTNGNRVERVSDKMRPLWDLLPDTAKSQAAMAYWDDRVFVRFPGSGRTWELDLTTNSWWVHDWGGTLMVTANWGSPKWTLYSLVGGQLWSIMTRDPGTGGLYYDPDPSDANGNKSYVSVWASGLHTFQHTSLRKRLRRALYDGTGVVNLYVLNENDLKGIYRGNGTLALTASGTWGDNSPGQWGVNDGGTWGLESGLGQLQVLTPGVARMWGVKFGRSDASYFEVWAYTLVINWRKDPQTLAVTTHTTKPPGFAGLVSSVNPPSGGGGGSGVS